ncbi:MAG: DNA polymerase I [Polyangiaceae bacterium]|nr:DNA polymerase I [Polyangiaceae bacterium]
MTKTLTGASLDLDDGPAHGCDVFLVDGNNLAYRAYYALPEELATTDGQPTNALLGFANMLFKLLVDYKPRAVAVAWDTRPVERLQLAAASLAAKYKSERKPMPNLLGEQFPHFRPIVEAFGYRNLEFEGWEADDVIATLATRADQEKLKTCVVSTDRDAFQLVTEHVRLMMTPRGVSDVQVYTPERVEARYGIKPHQIPDFIGLKGDTSDNIPGVPGIGEKTAAQLIDKYGSLEGVLEHAAELPPARGRAIREFAEQARGAKAIATMRRDLDLDCDPAKLVLSPPDRSKMREMFRRFEFKALLKRVDLLDEALPAAAREVVGTAAPWHALTDADLEGTDPLAVAVREGRVALAREDGVAVGWWTDAIGSKLAGRAIVAHDAKSLPRTGARVVEDTMIAAYLVEPARPAYLIDELASEQGVEVVPSPAPDAGTAAVIREAETSRRLASRYRGKLAERSMLSLYETMELPLAVILAEMEDRGIRVDTQRLHAITGDVAKRVSTLEAKAHELAGEPFVLASPKQLGHVLFDKLGLEAGRKTKTGYSTDTRVLRSIREAHPIVPIIEEYRELSTLLHNYLDTLPGFVRKDGRVHTTFRQTSASTGRLATSDPNLQAIPVRTELGRTIRAAFIADPGFTMLSADYSQVELRLLAHISKETVLLDAFRRGDDIHAATAAEIFEKDREAVTEADRTMAKRVNFGILYGISAFGLSEDLDIPREEAQKTIDAYLSRLPAVRAFIAETIERARQEGFVTTLFGRRRPVPEIRATNRQTRALGERLAVNTIIQGSAADIIKVAMLGVAKRTTKERSEARLLLQVHDELLFEVPDAELTSARSWIAEEMVAAFPMDPPLVVDIGTGPDWSTAKHG